MPLAPVTAAVRRPAVQVPPQNVEKTKPARAVDGFAARPTAAGKAILDAVIETISASIGPRFTFELRDMAGFAKNAPKNLADPRHTILRQVLTAAFRAADAQFGTINRGKGPSEGQLRLAQVDPKLLAKLSTAYPNARSAGANENEIELMGPAAQPAPAAYQTAIAETVRFIDELKVLKADVGREAQVYPAFEAAAAAIQAKAGGRSVAAPALTFEQKLWFSVITTDLQSLHEGKVASNAPAGEQRAAKDALDAVVELSGERPPASDVF